MNEYCNSLSVILALSLLAGCGGSGGSGGGDAKPDDNPSPPDIVETPTLPAEHDGFFAYYTGITTASNQNGSHYGPYADIVVNLGQQGQLIFSSRSSYRPVWHFGDQQQAVEHLAQIQAPAGSALQFDGHQGFAYARIIEQSADEVVVHWRYLKQPSADQARNPTAVVHELYRIKSTGELSRIYRPGTNTIEQWQSGAGAIEQQLQLSPNGIEVLASQALTLTPEAPASANPVKTVQLGEPLLAHWRFDEMQGEQANDSQGQLHAQIDSHGGHWQGGISGGALVLDGYRTKAQLDSTQLADLGSSYSIQAWVNLAALPWNVAPIVHRSNAFGEQGVYVGIDPTGRIIATLNGQTLQSNEAVPRNQWAQVVLTVGEQLVLYVNGNEVARSSRTASMQLPDVPWVMGRNTTAMAASDGVRSDESDAYHHFSSIYGIEGLVDEISIHAVELSAADILEDYQQLASSVQAPPRSLPDLDSLPQQFGAVHTRLNFHPQWDNLWRVPEYEDIVVRFDDKPVSYVYWRGTSHGMNLVTDDYWMSDQSVEMIIPDLEDEENAGIPFNNIVTLAEHMSDKAALRTHVRLIENSAARVKVHWRYAAADVFGTPILDNAFIDETHTIYPDGIAIRSVFYHPAADSVEGPAPGVVFYQDFQWLTGPGQRPEDFMHRNAVSLAELSGPATDLIYPYQYQDNEDGESVPEAGQIAVLNSKTQWKVFGISQGSSFYPAGNNERSPHVSFDGGEFPFAGPWNHWPVAQIPSDGRYVRDYDRVSHFALGVLEAFNYGSGSMMYGFTDSDANALGDPTALQGLAKSWHQPATVSAISGAVNSQVSYNKNERAFELQYSTGNKVALNFQATAQQPLWNPALVIKNWPSNNLPTVSVNGTAMSEARTAIERDIDGRRMLVAYIAGHFNSDTSIQFDLSL